MGALLGTCGGLAECAAGSHSSGAGQVLKTFLGHRPYLGRCHAHVALKSHTEQLNFASHRKRGLNRSASEQNAGLPRCNSELICKAQLHCTMFYPR